MKMAKIKTDKYEAMLKVDEEDTEFLEAVRSGSRQQILAEGFDKIQATFSYFYSIGITEEEIRSHMKLHYQKLEQRHEEGRINIEEWSEY